MLPRSHAATPQGERSQSLKSQIAEVEKLGIFAPLHSGALVLLLWYPPFPLSFFFALFWMQNTAPPHSFRAARRRRRAP